MSMAIVIGSKAGEGGASETNGQAQRLCQDQGGSPEVHLSI